MLAIVPISFAAACAFVNQHHRHHRAPQGHKFSLGLSEQDNIVGVAMVGRPVSRHLDDGWTLEVRRLCTTGTANACSKLYAACWKATKALGYRQLITYILSTESGITLKAAGWQFVGKAGGGSWDTPSRRRTNVFPTQGKLKFCANPQYLR